MILPPVRPAAAASPPHRRARIAWGPTALASALLLAGAGAHAAEAKRIEHIPASRFTYVHRVPLKDAEGKVIGLQDKPLMPFSARATCDQCHEYDRIRHGWHFDAPQSDVPPGRPGQPWFLVSLQTGTQIPLSYRPWPHTWRPADVGMTPWQFVQMFGRHIPGGGPGEMTDTEDPAARWLVSGKLEINCLACHSDNPTYDHIEWYLQIAAQNHLWAAAATTDLASVHGAARRMPDFYDPFMGPADDQTAKSAPTVVYDPSRFDSKGRVFFDLPNQPPSRRCYFCHNNRPVGPGAPDMWKTDQDVHLAAGLQCADCHRNGLDHRIRRGYEGEPGAETSPALATLTCRGCHLGDRQTGAAPGRLGAPQPIHKGLPPFHLERLTCTACHSGLYPKATAQRVQTSRAHALEYQGPHRGDDALPFIVEPVFARRPYDGRIGPQRMVWPAFWGRMADGGKIAPLSAAAVTEAAGEAIRKARKVAPGDSPTEAADRDAHGLTAEQIVAGLAALKALAEGNEAVYVAGGRLYRLAADGTLEVEEGHEAAAPCSWPIAHDVRPVSESLGVGKNCSDCHAIGSPFFFGEVAAEGPVSGAPPRTLRMYEFQGRDPVQLAAWALSYKGRPMFKIVGYAVAAVTALVLLLYALHALGALTRWFGAKAPGGQAEGPP
jgi:hypothetical protein